MAEIKAPKPYSELDKVLNAVVHQVQFTLKEANQTGQKAIADQCLIQLKAIEAFRKAFAL